MGVAAPCLALMMHDSGAELGFAPDQGK